MAIFSRRTLLKVGFASLAFPTGPLLASTKRIAVNDAGVAIDGYDTTAYWEKSAAHSGDELHVVMWQDTPWHFATAEEAATFAANPEKFTPQFGGFCTRAMSFKKIVNGDPEVWRIYQDNLYLFALPVGGKKFDKGQDAMIAKAQTHWDSLG